MILCSIEIDRSPCVGVKTDLGIRNITALGFPARMIDVLWGGPAMLSLISESLERNSSRLTPIPPEADNLKFLPVTKPQKIICEGLNYKGHAEETGGEVPKYPIFFSKFNDSLSAHKQPVKLPPWLSKYDYEAELVIVVGEPTYNVSEEAAGNCIFGYTCGNDLSARDSQFLSSQWLSGKALPGFAPVGPYIVTRDSFDPSASHAIRCEVNGATVQSGDTSDMIFTCQKALSEASRYFPLNPGDLIFTGTPAGVMIGRKKEDRTWLKPGDTVNVTIDGIGTLTTPLV